MEDKADVYSETTELYKEIAESKARIEEICEDYKNAGKPEKKGWRRNSRRYIARKISKGAGLPIVGERLESASMRIDPHGLDKVERELKDYTNRVGETILKCYKIRNINAERRALTEDLYRRAIEGTASVSEMETFIRGGSGIKQEDELTRIKEGIVQETGDERSRQAYLEAIKNVLDGYSAEDLLLKNTLAAQTYIHTRLMADAYAISQLNPAMKGYMESITTTSDAILREMEGMGFVSELFTEGTLQ